MEKRIYATEKDITKQIVPHLSANNKKRIIPHHNILSDFHY
jgi:hypothetical protein